MATRGPLRRRKAVQHRRRYTLAAAVFALLIVIAAWQIGAYAVRSHRTSRREAQMASELRDMEILAAPAELQGAGRDMIRAMAGAAREAADAPAQQDYSDFFVPAIAQNPDTVAALMAGSDIKTWVVQRDNEYYLTHDFAGAANSAGTAFMDARCRLSPNSRNLLIHGHNMYDGTVFGKLQDFQKASYVNVFPLLHLRTLDEDAYYAIFSVFRLSISQRDSSYFGIYRADFPSEEEFMAFAAEAKSRSLVKTTVDVREGDQLLTLLTCTNTSGNGRLAVMGRKLRAGESPADYANIAGDTRRDLYYQPKKTLMQGADVLQAQQMLYQLGYTAVSVDGVFGYETSQVVKLFQYEHGLEPDGNIGKDTWALLLELTGQSA